MDKTLITYQYWTDIRFKFTDLIKTNSLAAWNLPFFHPREIVKEINKLKSQPDPRMHSAEHILNQTMVRIYGCGRCFTAHIGRKKSKCDYHFDHALTDQEISDIQVKVQNVIDSDFPVTESFVSKDKAARLYNTEKLPNTVTGNLRIIHIGDYDACPCIGEHVSSSGEIGIFRITTTSYADGKLRIRFKLSRSSAVQIWWDTTNTYSQELSRFWFLAATARFQQAAILHSPVYIHNLGQLTGTEV